MCYTEAEPNIEDEINDVEGNGKKRVSFAPEDFVSRSEYLASCGIEEALNWDGSPPKDPLTPNKIAIRKELPNFIKAISLLAFDKGISRATVTYRLSRIAQNYLENKVKGRSSLDKLRNNCISTGNGDLVEVVTGADFLSNNWPDKKTTLIVLEEAKRRVGALGELMGIPVATLMQLGMAAVICNSAKIDGNASTYLLPQLDRLEEALYSFYAQMETLKKLLRMRQTRKEAKSPGGGTNKEKIINYLLCYGPSSPAEIAENTGIKIHSVYDTLARMRKNGSVLRVAGGKYELRDVK